MKLMLDTHSFLWLVEGSPNLSAAAQAALADPANELFLSVTSVRELAIKTGNRNLALSSQGSRGVTDPAPCWLMTRGSAQPCSRPSTAFPKYRRKSYHPSPGNLPSGGHPPRRPRPSSLLPTPCGR